jgi:hypothetical protein
VTWAEVESVQVRHFGLDDVLRRVAVLGDLLGRLLQPFNTDAQLMK